MRNDVDLFLLRSHEIFYHTTCGTISNRVCCYDVVGSPLRIDYTYGTEMGTTTTGPRRECESWYGFLFFIFILLS